MTAILRRIAIRLALCGAVSWAVWKMGLGPAVVIVTLPLYGYALARPLLDLASELRHEVRRAHWRDHEGRHCVFRGVPVSVREDAEHRRWIRLADVRAIVGHTATDAALQLTYPGGWRLVGRPPEPHLSDDALLAHLDKERSPDIAKFRRWAEREIAFPARRQRERFGIRIGAPSASGDD